METRCAHQIICGGSWEPPPDWGRCQECTPDAANARCPGYRPLPVPDQAVTGGKNGKIFRRGK